MAKKAVKKAATKKSAAKPKAVKKTVVKAKAASKPAKVVKAKAVKAKPVEKKKAPAKTTKRTHVEVISPTKKVKKIQGYSRKDLEEFKKVILEKRNEIIEQLQVLKDQMMDPTTGQYVNENSPYSLHMAEQGTDAMEREKLYLWAQRENKFLGYLDDALQRIENGTFGICIECIDEPQNLCPTCPLVPKERLMAVPHTQHCLQVKQKMKS
ncbi:MAG: conjugal transfer protein TraR [Stygiobacter sp. RIFOXYC12_FULL_38_8]|nr:MAG: conjugal transfer protein TraR [Stygiobacter sp. RIFOXYA12_FULL_38_9]OGV07350.1 MAG: conjugal transfer protein TraR [Stygiobacter sp. RIFOXYB2_FULL_37_11]OGV09864.1 MAG: conjugal transfer protein TraR [Stygiobacter sp. RIFOXYA2_FULL_38_8]OGV16201.1 MAG: conjugal transfer protein TraR [Stygiobacter sp. RIFOXYC2_FULL_38_25]OGV29660.1 MAG: conjugal transfer protein TraR [Stygiobacter sp. RIFOXYC12_FULL_38_8]OGV81705.1 MAG: conjugal transfer protein TraR [Stygiobacter sp. GWF2_38_21]RJQ59